MQALVRFMVERSLLINLISVFIVALGLYAMFTINREAFPNINLDRIVITAAYPGATPDEVERLIVTPVEQELKSLDGIDKMISVSFPGSAQITLDLDPDANNRDRIVSDTQLAVDRANLPDDLPDDPVVTEIDGAVFPILRLAVGAPLDPVALKRLGERIEDDLLAIDGVARVVTQGERKAQIRVTVDPEKIRAQRVSIGEIADALARWNVSASAGDIDTADGQESVRIVGEFRNPEDAANVVLRANERGEGIRLGDIATVSEALEEASVYHDVAGEPALSMLVLKKGDADIISTVDRIKDYLASVPGRYGDKVRVATFQDFSRFARLRLGVLTNNGMVGMVLVFVTLMLFLRPSVALTTTWGMPIVFLAGLYVLEITGVTLNLISMFGFIMVLGMLVDDAIIIGENITYHMERGMMPIKAAVHGAYELLGPVTATVMTTIIAFLPLMFMSGIIGKFIVAIPTVVISLLFFSWLESFLILPSHVASVARADAHPKERAWLLAIEHGYARMLGFAVRHRWLTVVLSLAVLVGSFVLARTAMSFQLFPSAGVDQYIMRVTAPAGTSLETMRARLIDIDKVIRSRIDPAHLEATLLTSGETAIDDGDPLTQRGGRFGQIRVIYTPAVTRPDHDALDDMHRLENELPPMYPQLEIAFSEIKPGPPTGRPLEAELSASRAEDSEAAARRLITFLEAVPGVSSVESGLQPGDPELHIVVDRVLATYAGVDLATAARHVRAAVDGLTVSTTRRGTEEIDIAVAYPHDGHDDMALLKTLQIPNARGGLVPLERIARFEQLPGLTAVRHKNGIRVVQVAANINADVTTSAQLNRLVAQNQGKWLGDLAGKVQVNYGGEEEKNQESVRDLAFSFLFALLGIFFILAVQFNNLSYPLIVMLAIPFGAIGIILSFYFHDLLWRPMPLSFMSMMGMVALSGVVVNSSLVLLVFIQRLRQEGMELTEAIMLAGRRRLRAVILTAATTVVGLLPTAYGWGGMDPFVAPMALALSWGLIFATLITLITIPATLAVAVDTKNALRRLLGLLRRGRA
jgi:multidrug efflux pump subunit AcrB